MGCLKLKSEGFAFVSATSADAEPANPFGNEGAHSDFPQGKMNYDYSPFGKMISKSGTKADDMTFRLAGYVYDTETDLVYYGYRYYDANTGRWLSRDPIGERGGMNLYRFINNAPIIWIDRLGLDLVYTGVPSGGGSPWVPHPNPPPLVFPDPYPSYIPGPGKKPKPGTYKKNDYVFSAYYNIELDCDVKDPTVQKIDGSTYDMFEIMRAINAIPECCCIKKLIVSAHYAGSTISPWPNIDQIDEGEEGLRGTIDGEAFVKGMRSKNFCKDAAIKLNICSSATMAIKLNDRIESETGNNVSVTGWDGTCKSANDFDWYVPFMTGDKVTY